VSESLDLVRVQTLPLAPRTVRRAIHLGDLPAVKIGRDLHVSLADYRRWVDSHRVLPRGTAPATAPAPTPADEAVDRAIASGGLRRVAKRAPRRA